jgi:hypothetical protein
MPTAKPIDPLLALQHDLAQHRARIKTSIQALAADAPTRAVLVELEGTALAFQADALAMLGQVRDFLFGQLREVEGDLGGAIDDLEAQIGGEEETQFTVEDAVKFTFVVQAAQRLAELGVGAPGQSREGKEELQKILKQAAECLTIVRENTLEEDDEDGAEGDADDDEDDDEAEGDADGATKPS